MFKNTHHDLHHILHAIGRHRGRHGFRGGFADRFGGPPGGRFGGGDGFPGGRKLGSDELQLVLLALLAEQPAHGYELIRMLEERSGGFYAPSPGMIYPALTYLDEIGHAAATPEGNRKLYAITDAGRAYLALHRDAADGILETLARIGSRMAEARDAFAHADPEAAGALREARHALRAALHATRGAGPEEAQRIARILARAAAEIRGEPASA